MKNSKLNSQSGQVGIIVLLISAIVLVIGLSIANRVTLEGQATIQQEDSSRVFNTAETGIEQALNNIFEFEAGTAELSGDFNFNDANLNQVSVSSREEFEGFIQAGEMLKINVADGQTGTIDLNWSKTSCDQGAADLLISHYYQAGTAEANFYMVGNCEDYDDQDLIAANSSTETAYNFNYQMTIDATNNQSSFIRIYPLQVGTDLKISASSGLLSNVQYVINSLAQNQSGSSAKAIEVKRNVPASPSFMDFTLVSGGSLAK